MLVERTRLGCAGRECELPPRFLSLLVERRRSGSGGRRPVIVTGLPHRGSSLRAGDVLRQANGRRTQRVRDLEAAAAEALAKGLWCCSLAAERDGAVFVAGLSTSPAEPAPDGRGRHVRISWRRLRTRPTLSGSAVAAEPPADRASAARRDPRWRDTGRGSRGGTAAARRRVAGARREGRRRGGRARDGRRGGAPRRCRLRAYERRLEEAKNAIAALRIDGRGERRRTGRDRGGLRLSRDGARHPPLQGRRADRRARRSARGRRAVALPYFSDSDVPRWVERYPFLSETLQQAPRTTHHAVAGRDGRALESRSGRRALVGAGRPRRRRVSARGLPDA